MNNIDALLYKSLRKDIKEVGKLGKIDLSIIYKIIQKSTIARAFIESNKDFNVFKTKCWIWEGPVGSSPRKGHQHGTISYDGQSVQVHRLMFHNFIAEVPIYERKADGLQVNHKCTHENNGRCINPWHMYLGTPKENTKDAIDAGTKGECKKGQQNHNSVLSDEQIKEIMKLKDSGRSQYDIAEEFKINQSQVSRYWNGVTRTPYIKRKKPKKSKKQEKKTDIQRL
jgi:hypothetical protein